MKSVSLALTVALSGTIFITACGQSSTPTADAKVSEAATAQKAVVAPAAPAVAPAGLADKLVIQGFASTVPSSWTPSQPSSPMRVAQFALPAAPGADAGELAAYFFPTGQGGSHQANIERWASQFTDANGKPVAPKVSTNKSGDMEVTVVELQGTYSRGVGMGPTGDAKPDQTLMVAMVETTIGRITLQMYGPNKTLSAQRDGFLKLAKGFHAA
jgi:hypothetical protein